VAVEHIEEIADFCVALQVAGDAIGIQTNAGAVGDQQEIPPALRGPRSDRFQQHRIALRILPVQGQQVGIGGKRAGFDHELVIPAQAGTQ